MRHQDMEKLLIRYEERDLDKAEAIFLEEHLRECPDCQDDLHFSSERQALRDWHGAAPSFRVSDAVVTRLAMGSRWRAGQGLKRLLFSWRARAVAASVLLIAIAILALVVARPWEGTSLSPIATVAHAYNGLLSLDTVQYRIDGENSYGQRFVQLFQVDMANGTQYSRSWDLAEDPASDPGIMAQQPDSEHLIVDGKQYRRTWSGQVPPGVEKLPGNWWLLGEAGRWDPFYHLGGLPWGGQAVAVERFDEVIRLPDTNIEGKSVEHYRATRESIGNGSTSNDMADIWVGKEDRLLSKVNWTHQERWGPPISQEELGRDWCEDGQRMVTLYPVEGSPLTFASYAFDSSGSPVAIACQDDQNQKGTMNIVRRASGLAPEEPGYDLTVHWIYTFTKFNEPLELPTPLPE